MSIDRRNRGSARIAAGVAFALTTVMAVGANAAAFQPKAGQIVTRDIGGVRFHTYVTMGVNNHVIETAKSLILVDVSQARANNDELKAFITSLKKPLVRIYISHDHAHHWIGLPDFPNVPVYALPEVIASMKDKGPGELQRARQQMGEPVVPYKDVVIPQHAVQPGNDEIDGLTIVLIDPDVPFLKGNLYMEFPAQGVLIHHHLAYVGVHVPMPPIEPRIELLKAYKARNYAWVMAGHGSSMEGGAFFDKSIEYYTTLAKVVGETTDSAAAKAKTKAAYPDWGGDALLDRLLPAFFAGSRGPSPTHANLDYAPPEPPTSNGHKLDLYLPAGATGPLPVVIWTGGSAWMADTGKRTAGGLAAQLNPAGYAVAGVSIRSSSQAQFPGQLHDIKAAIRWLRANATRYNLDPDHIAIMGDSSGGWTAAMAAVTGDAPEMEGSVGTTGVSSRVQAAVAFYPPTDFLTMDAWALQRCDAPRCHDGEGSPESRLVGCAIQTCPDKVQAASPLRYITAADPPIMILHGNSDPLVPHNQGEQLYMALNKACREAIFISLPKAPHGNWNGFLTDDALREAATMRSTSVAGCTVTNPTPYRPTWKTVIDFLDEHMRG